jgi:nitroimidazol reductase NimA-like FMN-containing flavoprotein (pyridoxamine 5'-phosphate oxidase superfamily)
MLTDQDRRFLTEVPRLGLLTTEPPPGTWPAPVPVWFACAETGVELFSLRGTPKLEAIERRPYASLVAVNHLHEPEGWVCVAGTARVEESGAFELAARLAARYWDLSDPARAGTLASWERAADRLVRISIAAEDVRRYGS